jgi:peptidyl-prolyl cis-trans isomerase C
VLQLDRRIEGKTLPFETVQAKIAAYLEERVWRQAVRQYIELLVGNARIIGLDLRGASSPLVQ